MEKAKQHKKSERMKVLENFKENLKLREKDLEKFSIFFVSWRIIFHKTEGTCSESSGENCQANGQSFARREQKARNLFQKSFHSQARRNGNRRNDDRSGFQRFFFIKFMENSWFSLKKIRTKSQ